MTLILSDTMETAIVTAMAAKIEEGTLRTRAFIEIRSGVRPKTLQGSLNNTTLLATVELGDPGADKPAFRVSGTVIAANNVNDDASIIASGEATWFRMYNRNNVAVLDGDVGPLTSQTAELRLKTTTLIEGRVVKLSDFRIGFA